MLKMDDKEIKQFERDLKTFAHRAYPFATKHTVNSSAFEARKIAQESLDDKFTLRNKWTKRSIKVEQTRTLNVKKQMALVGSDVPYMERQEFGGTARAGGKYGVPLTTSYAAGLPMRARPRTKNPKKMHRRTNIKLGGRIGKKRNKAQRNIIAINQARKSGHRHVFLKIRDTEGIFEVPKKTGRRPIKMLYNLSHNTTQTPRTPWLSPAVNLTKDKIPGIYKNALIFQLKRHKLFGS